MSKTTILVIDNLNQLQPYYPVEQPEMMDEDYIEEETKPIEYYIDRAITNSFNK